MLVSSRMLRVLWVVALLGIASVSARNALACPSEPPVPPTNTYGGGGVVSGGGGTYTGGNGATPPVSQSQCLATYHPINCASGNQTEEQTDLMLGGRAPVLHVTRSYNSQAAAEAKEAGPWGYGWSGPYSSHLEFNKESGAVTVVQETGATAMFALEAGIYVPGSWIQATLTKEEVEAKPIYVFMLPSQEMQKFNAEGKLIEQRDRNGNAIVLSYESGKLTKAKDGAGRELNFTYTGSQVTSVEDPLGRKVKYTYESGNLATATLPGEETARWKFKYDASHQLVEETNGRGGVTKTEYDEKHRAVKQTDPMERVTKFAYGESEGKKATTITEPNGSTTFEKFNEAGEPLEVVKAKGTGIERKTTDEYNQAYELIKSTDALGHSTTFEYDAAGDRTLEKDPEGDERKWTYDATRDVETETAPRGEKTTYKRDSHGNVEAVERSAPGETIQKTTFKHASNGDLESAIDPLGHEAKFEYDTYGDLKAEVDPEGDKTTLTYDKDGELVTEVSPRGNEEGAKPGDFETITERDSQGRPIKVTDPLGHETKTAYDKDGNTESVTDALGHTTKYTYDAHDERTKTEQANGDTAEVAYDSMGEVKSRTDGNGYTTKYERNALEQSTETIDPLERKSKREYDAAGNLKKTEDASGRTITYGYDAANRLKEVDYSEEGTHDVTFKYDKDGNVVEMTDGTGTTTKVYDLLDRLTEVKNGTKEVVKYVYNLGNQQTEITYPNGKSVKRAFDKAGRIGKITDWFGYETSFAYNRNSQLKATTSPGEVVDESSYDRDGQIVEISNKKKGELRGTVSYTRDKLGRVEKDVEPGQEVPEYKYEYDAANRLTKSNAAALEYDKANNPTKIGSATYTYDKADEIATASNASFEFNKMGQRVKETPTGGTAIPYVYNQAGNLISTKGGGVESTFKSDGSGLLVTETANATTYSLTWDVSSELPLLLHSGDEYFIYGPEGSAVEQILASNGTATFLHHDQHGSIRALTNEVGEITGAYSYGPTGEVMSHVGIDFASLGYGGQYRMHSGKQLIYMRARIYDPATAQFLSFDPAFSETGEGYSYAKDDAVNLADPSGLGTDGICLAGSAAVSFIGVSGSVCLVATSSGEEAFTATVPVGWTTAFSPTKISSLSAIFRSAALSDGASADFEYVHSQASTLRQFEGLSRSVDLSVGYFPIHGGVERAVSLQNGLTTWTVKFGVGTTGLTLAGGVTNTVVLYKFPSSRESSTAIPVPHLVGSCY